MRVMSSIIINMQATLVKGLVPVLTSRPPAAARPRRSVARSAYDEAAKMFGEDFGARDPTRGEIETNFSDKVWFNWNTEHIIKPPESMKRVMGMSSKDCMPVEDLELLEESEIAKIKTQALGWRVEKEGAHFKLVQDFRVKDSASGEALLSRFTTLAQQQNHPTASTSALDESLVRVELMTQVPGKEGLTYNDFILAIKINATPMADLAPPKRKKYWA